MPASPPSQLDDPGLWLPVYPALRVVRLTAAHAESLFGKDGVATATTALLPLRCGWQAAMGTVAVRGPGGALPVVRVVLPLVSRTAVWLLPRDLAVLGIEGPHPPVGHEGSLGVTLAGPAGTVVLAEGLLSAERIMASGSELRDAGLPTRGIVTTQLHTDNRRTDRQLSLDATDALRGVFVVDDQGEFAGPAARALVTASGG
jgi:propanediol utilization protein